MARKRPHKKLKTPIPYLIGAGITETCYFEHLRSILGFQLRVFPRLSGRESIDSLNKRIENVLSDGSKTIVVFDVDVPEREPKEKGKLDKLREKYADDERVVLCDSMPSIEYWFLLHYKRTNRYFGSSKEVINELLKYISGFAKHRKFLEDSKWVRDMIGEGRMDQAMQSAKSFGTDGGSFTNVWKAIENLSEKRE